MAPGVIYNINQFSGAIFQFVCELRKKHMTGHKEVLAAGGRYDAMIQSYRRMMETAGISKKNVQQSAVGISLSLDRLVQGIIREEDVDLPNCASFDVAVSSVGTKAMIAEKTKLLRELWSVGIRPILVELTPNGDIPEQYTELKNPHIIMLKDSNQGGIPVRIWEKNRYQEKLIKSNDLVETLQRLIKNSRDTTQDLTLPVATTSKESRTCSKGNVVFLVERRLTSHSKKTTETRINKDLEYLLQKIIGDVIVLATDLTVEILRDIATKLECESEGKFQISLDSIER